MRLRILNDKSGPIALWAFWVLCVLGAVVFLLVVASQASAQVGTVVGKEATISWTEADTSGCPQLGFKQYDAATPTPVPVPGTTPPATILAPPAIGNAPTQLAIGNANPGQHYSWITAYCPSTSLESGVQPTSVAWWFTLAPPAVPGGLAASVVGGVCTITWTPPTTNADGTTLIGTATSAPVTYLVYSSTAATPPIPGTTVPTFTQATTSLACTQVPATQRNLWVAAQNINGVSGVQSSPLALSGAPSTPSGVTIR